jgi:hypothetical protein
MIFPMMRAVAITLLLFMCCDLGMDLVTGESGDFIDLSSAMSHASKPESNPSQSDLSPSPDTKQTHECFCCCSHIEHQSPTVVYVEFGSTARWVSVPQKKLDPDPIYIYHPPQLFA